MLASFFVGWAVNVWNVKRILIAGLALSLASGVSLATMKVTTSYWASVFPTCMLGVVGISLVYNVVSISMMASPDPSCLCRDPLS